MKKTGFGFKKVIIAAMVCCVMAQAVILCAQESQPIKPDKRNAAWCYHLAFGLLKYQDSKELNSKITLILQKGWQGQDTELEAVLKDNEPAFREFDKALKLKKCDFNFGRQYKYLIQKEIPTYSKIRAMFRLNLLRARYNESLGKPEKALAVYESNLVLARNISSDNTMMMRMIGLVIEKETCIALKGLLNSAKLSKKSCLKLYDFLRETENNHFPAQELIELEQDAFLSLMAMLADTYIENSGSQDNAQASSEEKAKVASLAEEVKKRAEELAVKYYGNFATAIKSNKQEDWDFAANELSSLIKEAQPKIEDFPGFIKAVLSDSAKGTSQAMDKTLANKIVLTLLSLTIPNFKGIGEGYYSALSELSKLKALALIKASQ